MFQYPLQSSIIAAACVALIVSACGSNDVAAIDAAVSPGTAKYLTDTVLTELSFRSSNNEAQVEGEKADQGAEARFLEDEARSASAARE